MFGFIHIEMIVMRMFHKAKKVAAVSKTVGIGEAVAPGLEKKANKLL